MKAHRYWLALTLCFSVTACVAPKTYDEFDERAVIHIPFEVPMDYRKAYNIMLEKATDCFAEPVKPLTGGVVVEGRKQPNDQTGTIYVRMVMDNLFSPEDVHLVTYAYKASYLSEDRASIEAMAWTTTNKRYAAIAKKWLLEDSADCSDWFE